MGVHLNKFDQHSLNVNPSLDIQLKNRLDTIETIPDFTFNRDKVGKFTRLDNKNHIVTHADLPGWIIKRERKDEVSRRPNFRPDTNNYRIRKAKKIQKVLKANGDDKYVTVPKKYLYTIKSNNEQVVVAQKMEGRGLYFNENFSVNETRALTRLITEARVVDIHRGNFLRQSDGKLAIIDTEPLARGFKKAQKSTFTSYLFGSFAFLNVKFKAESFDMLALFSSREAHPDIEKAKNREILKEAAIVVGKIALAAILLVGTGFASQLLAPVISAGILIKATAVCALYLKVYLGMKFWDLICIPVVVANVNEMIRENAHLIRM